MRTTRAFAIMVIVAILSGNDASAQKETLSQQTEQAMLKATKFMVDSVSTHGGYLWYYLPISQDSGEKWKRIKQ